MFCVLRRAPFSTTAQPLLVAVSFALCLLVLTFPRRPSAPVIPVSLLPAWLPLLLFPGTPTQTWPALAFCRPPQDPVTRPCSPQSHPAAPAPSDPRPINHRQLEFSSPDFLFAPCRAHSLPFPPYKLPFLPLPTRSPLPSLSTVKLAT